MENQCLDLGELSGSGIPAVLMIDHAHLLQWGSKRNRQTHAVMDTLKIINWDAIEDAYFRSLQLPVR